MPALGWGDGRKATDQSSLLHHPRGVIEGFFPGAATPHTIVHDSRTSGVTLAELETKGYTLSPPIPGDILTARALAIDAVGDGILHQGARSVVQPPQNGMLEDRLQVLRVVNRRRPWQPIEVFPDGVPEDTFQLLPVSRAVCNSPHSIAIADIILLARSHSNDPV